MRKTMTEYECTNNNSYGLHEYKEGCRQNCSECDYYQLVEPDTLEVAISVKQPWAYLICAGIKPIENRTWKCPQKYIGKRVYIHASTNPATKGYYAVPFPEKFWNNLSSKEKDDMLNRFEIGSAIIGSVKIVDCVINHPSSWAEKSETCSGINHCENCSEIRDRCPYYKKPIYNWVLANPVLFDKPILNVKGKLGFWDCSEYLQKQKK